MRNILVRMIYVPDDLIYFVIYLAFHVSNACLADCRNNLADVEIDLSAIPFNDFHFAYHMLSVGLQQHVVAKSILSYNIRKIKRIIRYYF